MIVRESLKLFEIGEATAKPYEVKELNPRKYHPSGFWHFSFTTEDNDDYTIFFQVSSNKGEDLARVDFKTDSGKGNEVINKGRIFRILATVVQTIKKFIQDYPNIKYLVIIPGKNQGTDDRRLHIYTKYIEKLLPSEWEVGMDQIDEDGQIRDRIVIKII